MSRRHHGNRPHRSSGPPRPTDPVRSGPDAPATAANLGERASRPAPIVEPPAGPAAHPPDRPDPGRVERERPASEPAHEPRALERAATAHTAQTAPPPDATGEHANLADPVDERRATTDGQVDGSSLDQGRRDARPEPAASFAIPSCTAPQLRRFIKSRPYVPMHELRRRFGINGSDDDVSSIELGARHRVYVGLPAREGSLLGELLRGGDIGYELSLDPRTPIVIGLYPMRPVARS